MPHLLFVLLYAHVYVFTYFSSCFVFTSFFATYKRIPLLLPFDRDELDNTSSNKL